jgi:hypothetical protein
VYEQGTVTKIIIEGDQINSNLEASINTEKISLDWPISGRIIHNYGYTSSSCCGGYGERSFFDGLAISAPTGTSVRASIAGQVESVGYDDTYGNFVIIRHAGGYKTLYGHLESYNTRNGAYVDIDSVIGYVGNSGHSGHSSIPYLHFTVYKDGLSCNPRTLLRNAPQQANLVAKSEARDASSPQPSHYNSSVMFSKREARNWFMQGYNEGYDNYEPFSGSPVYDIGPRMPSNVQSDASISFVDKLAIANLYTAGYKVGWTDHGQRKTSNAYGAWDESSWGSFGPPYGLF